jgi:hypothetical protein
VEVVIEATSKVRRRAQWNRRLLACAVRRALILHAFNPSLPLFFASFAAFFVAALGIVGIPRMPGARLPRGVSGIRRVLLSVPAVSLDHAADQRSGSST